MSSLPFIECVPCNFKAVSKLLISRELAPNHSVIRYLLGNYRSFMKRAMCLVVYKNSVIATEKQMKTMTNLLSIIKTLGWIAGNTKNFNFVSRKPWQILRPFKIIDQKSIPGATQSYKVEMKLSYRRDSFGTNCRKREPFFSLKKD